MNYNKNKEEHGSNPTTSATPTLSHNVDNMDCTTLPPASSGINDKKAIRTSSPPSSSSSPMPTLPGRKQQQQLPTKKRKSPPLLPPKLQHQDSEEDYYDQDQQRHHFKKRKIAKAKYGPKKNKTSSAKTKQKKKEALSINDCKDMEEEDGDYGRKKEKGRAKATQLSSTMISPAFAVSKNTSKNMSGRGLLWPKGNQVHVGNNKTQNDRKKDEPTAWRVTTASPILSSVATTNTTPPDPTKNTHNNKEGIWPQINDVLMGNIEHNSSSSPGNNNSTTFHHIGNRRFRVLVEAKLDNFLGEVSIPQFLKTDDIAASSSSSPETQRQVVDSIVKCVRENNPSGRFLIPFSDSDDDDDDDGCDEEEKDYDPVMSFNWQLATDEDVKAKVHSTFLAAGRFHVKKMAVLVRQLAVAASLQQQQQQHQQQRQERRQRQQAGDIVAASLRQQQEEHASRIATAALNTVASLQQQERAGGIDTSGLSSQQQQQEQLGRIAKAALATVASLQHQQQQQTGGIGTSALAAAASLQQQQQARRIATAALATVASLRQHQAESTAASFRQQHASRIATAVLAAAQQQGEATYKSINQGCGEGKDAASLVEKQLEEYGEAAKAVQSMAATAASSPTDDVGTNTCTSRNEVEASSKSTGAASHSNDIIAKALAQYLANNKQATAGQAAPPLLGDVKLRQVKATALAEMMSTPAAVASTKATLQGDAKNGQVEASALAEMISTAVAAKREEELKQAAEDVASNNNCEIDYLAKESMRINALLARASNILPRVRQGLAHQGGGSVGLQFQQQQLRSRFPNIISNAHLRARNDPPKRAAMESSLANLPSSIDELYATSSSGRASQSSSPLSSGLTKSHISGSDESEDCSSISVQPQCEDRPTPSPAVVAPTRVVMPKDDKVGMPQEEEDANTAASALLKCPTRIKVFIALPMDRFFDDDGCDAPSYISPSNDDVLCGPGQSFFHHVGNRRFRITVEVNVHRYEKAYLASVSSGGATKERERSIQSLIDEMLRSILKCDPPGRFLGMEMATGRWRVLNRVFAQLKTEQTFFECLQVKRCRELRLQSEMRKMEGEWKCRMEQKKEMALQELQGRITEIAAASSVIVGNRMDTVETKNHPAESRDGLNPSQRSGRVTQVLLPDGGACLARNTQPLSEAGDKDLLMLQEGAKSLLRRRQPSCSPVPLLDERAGPPTAEELKSISMPDILQRFAQERLARQRLLNSLQQEGNEPMTSSSRTPSFLSQFQGVDATRNNVSSSSSMMMPVRQKSKVSCESTGHSTGPVDQRTASGTQQDAIHQVSASPNNGNEQHPQATDLLDVVGGMMMMSRDN